MKRLLGVLVIALFALVACEAEDEAIEDPEPDAEEDAEGPEDDYDLDDQPDDAAATFESPSDGDTVDSPFTVELAAEGVDLAEAGDPVVGEGHLHVMVDIGCLDDGEVIPGPSDQAEEEGYWHLGDGSTEREIDLEPGEYELCVQLGDGPHRAFGDTDTITVTVE